MFCLSQRIFNKLFYRKKYSLSDLHIEVVTHLLLGIQNNKLEVSSQTTSIRAGQLISKYVFRGATTYFRFDHFSNKELSKYCKLLDKDNVEYLTNVIDKTLYTQAPNIKFSSLVTAIGMDLYDKYLQEKKEYPSITFEGYLWHVLLDSVETT